MASGNPNFKMLRDLGYHYSKVKLDKVPVQFQFHIIQILYIQFTILQYIQITKLHDLNT